MKCTKTQRRQLRGISVAEVEETAETLIMALGVVVRDELPWQVTEVAFSEDNEMVEALIGLAWPARLAALHCAVVPLIGELAKLVENGLGTNELAVSLALLDR